VDREVFVSQLDQFYSYSNEGPAEPFAVDMRPVLTPPSAGSVHFPSMKSCGRSTSNFATVCDMAASLWFNASHKYHYQKY
jgi:hypothetical protein